jgi:hypothetical protein
LLDSVDTDALEDTAGMSDCCYVVLFDDTDDERTHKCRHPTRRDVDELR